MNTKQIIVIRKDLKMRRGKEISQACHASMAFLTKEMNPTVKFPELGMPYYTNAMTVKVDNVGEVIDWLRNSFRKIVCYVNSEQELIDLHQKALDKGLISHMVEDNGATEFDGILTKTCIAIGPHEDSEFEGLTDNLPLL